MKNKMSDVEAVLKASFVVARKIETTGLDKSLNTLYHNHDEKMR